METEFIFFERIDTKVTQNLYNQVIYKAGGDEHRLQITQYWDYMQYTRSFQDL